MLALVTTAGDPMIEPREVCEPVPRSSQAVVEVHAASLNRGEVRRLPEQPEGFIPGWDLAGTVRTSAADGSGPPVGARVAALTRHGAWAEFAAVDTATVGVIPDGVSFADAATLPVAGLTALRALALGGFVLGARILITGGSGGVGRFAVQLAKAAGAWVMAVSGDAARAVGLEDLGADRVVPKIPNDERFDIVLEGVGGESLSAAVLAVAPRGFLVTFGNSAMSDGVFHGSFYGHAPEATIHAFVLYNDLARTRSGPRDIELLAAMVADGRLRTEVNLTVDWRSPEAGFKALLTRQLRGKAVLKMQRGSAKADVTSERDVETLRVTERR